jgi:hypothetical protein
MLQCKHEHAEHDGDGEGDQAAPAGAPALGGAGRARPGRVRVYGPLPGPTTPAALLPRRAADRPRPGRSRAVSPGPPGRDPPALDRPTPRDIDTTASLHKRRAVPAVREPWSFPIWSRWVTPDDRRVEPRHTCAKPVPNSPRRSPIRLRPDRHAVQTRGTIGANAAENPSHCDSNPYPRA